MNCKPVTFRPASHTHMTGTATGMEVAFRFIRWAEARKAPLKWEDVKEYLGCSRATAYRWLSAYNAARGASSQADQ